MSVTTMDEALDFIKKNKPVYEVNGICHCGGTVELWIPPTVKCKGCGSIYPWSESPQCVSGNVLLARLKVEITDVTPPR